MPAEWLSVTEDIKGTLGVKEGMSTEWKGDMCCITVFGSLMYLRGKLLLLK